MRALAIIACVCFLGGTYGSSPGADSSQGLPHPLSHMANGPTRLESKDRKIDEVEARVDALEGLVRSQGQIIQEQGQIMQKQEQIIQRQGQIIQKQTRKLNRLELLLKDFPQLRKPSTKITDEFAGTMNVVKEPEGQVTSKEWGHNVENAGDTISTPVSRMRPKGVASTVRRGTSAAVEHVAFSAELNHDTGHLGDHQIVAFNKVLLNDGNAYNSFTGSFTCPVAGVYIFLYNVGHRGIGQTWLQMMINGKVQNVATADSSQAVLEVQGGNSVIVRLAAGDTLWVEAIRSSISHNVVDGSELLSSFSGALLYQ